jgi:hypothetical protein
MQRKLLVILLVCAYSIPFASSAQDKSAIPAVDGSVTSKYIDAVSAKSEKLTGQIDKQTAKYLDKLEKQEAKLRKKLSKIDSVAANNIFANSAKKYEALKQKANAKAGKYIPLLDTFTTSLKFLDQYKSAFSNIKQSSAQLKDALSKAKGLEDKFRQTDDVRAFIKERSQLLQEQLQKYNLGNNLKQFSKDAYYYSQQVQEYKDALQNPDKIERKAIELLTKVPAFKDFMKKNSMLSSLFPQPENYGTLASLAGLQTRAQVQQLVQDRIASGGPNARELVSQNLDAAQAALNGIKAKAEKLGQSKGSDLEMPDFKPNQQKTKSFFKRLEYGTNVQTVRGNYFFPVTSDIGLTVAYKLNDKSSIGLGASYKMGWGKDIKHISITHEGIGLRSFADLQIKGSFYASGGFEYNYQQPFQSLQQINNLGNWQQSGLVGISKVVSLKTKFFQKTKLQLLWDFLSYQQKPVTQPIKFRVGYSFK